MGVEFWKATGNVQGRAAALAAEAERDGYDGMTLSDTPCQTADPLVGLALAAGTTKHLGLGLGVTNSVTRHPSTLAAAMATVQLASDGRAVIGIGRGDSAVTKVGLEASKVDVFEQYVTRLQGYLSGEVVELDGPMARLAWVDGPKVPVDVAASGPKMVAVAARHAERITFNIGADPDRVAHFVDLAREGGRNGRPESLGAPSLGLYVNVAPHPDEAIAHQLVKPVVAVYMRFSGMGGHTVEGVPPKDAAVIEAVASNYDMARHAQSDASHLEYLDDEFVGRFAVAGSPEHCTQRLTELAVLGIGRFIVAGPAIGEDPDHVAESRRLLAGRVIPAVRAALAASPSPAATAPLTNLDPRSTR